MSKDFSNPTSVCLSSADQLALSNRFLDRSEADVFE